MSCPTCAHTMNDLGLSAPPLTAREPVRRVYWCPRCGTLREELSDAAGHQTNDEAPKLVERCRELGETLAPPWAALWRRLGIAEAIDTPGAA